MKTLVVVLVFCMFAVLGSSAETYPEEYDKLDVDSLLQDEVVIDSFSKCLQSDTDCSEKEGKIKVILVDALNTSCSKCTEIQKGHIRKTANFFMEKRSDDWKKIVDIHDPDRAHAEGFMKFMEEE